MPNSALSIALIGLVALLCQWLAWRVRLPAILFLLLAGLALGPMAGWLEPDQVFGELLFPLVSLAVAVILFEGSLTLDFRELGGLSTLVRRMITVTAPVTWLVVTLASHYLVGLSWGISTLFGALMVVTGPTVVTPLLRSVRPSERVGNVLRWEGIVIDPIGALLVVVVYEFIVTQAQGAAFSQSLLLFFEVILVGLVVGLAAGYLLGKLLERRWLPDYLHNLASLSLVFGVFSFCNYLAHESGLLGVTVMGMWLGNQRDLHMHNILNFKENLTILFISGLFIILAARLPREQLHSIFSLTPLLLLLVIQFVARPLGVALASLGSDFSWRERLLVSWIAPRGIVAAAVSALFALQLTAQGFAEAEQLLPLTFAVILGTVVFQSATSRPLALWLGIAEPEPRGLLILGANSLARSLAQALKKEDLPVRLCDSNWGNIQAARMEGLESFYGNPMSEYANQRLELSGLGNLLALTPQRDLNAMACMHFQREFGAEHVYAIRTGGEEQESDKHQVASHLAGHYLFDEQGHYFELNQQLASGAKIRATRFTDQYRFEDFQAQASEDTHLLFALTDRGKLTPYTGEHRPEPEEGWTLLSLSPAPKETRQSESHS